VDKLGKIMKVSKQYNKPFDNHLISGGIIGEILLNISKLTEMTK
jgi:hypothetical protein